VELENDHELCIDRDIRGEVTGCLGIISWLLFGETKEND
jgi:hypothetical protein